MSRGRYGEPVRLVAHDRSTIGKFSFFCAQRDEGESRSDSSPPGILTPVYSELKKIKSISEEDKSARAR